MKQTYKKRLLRLATSFLAFSIVLGSFGFLVGSVGAVDGSTPSIVPLKDVYADHFLLGSVISPNDINNAAKYNFLKLHFNALTPENATKPDSIWNRPTNTPNFTSADNMITAVKNDGFYTVGHALAWHNQSTNWPTAGLTYDEAKVQLKHYIDTIAGHFYANPATRFDAWDVVNEAMRDNPENPTDWRNALRHDDLPIERPSKWYRAYANGGNGWEYVYDAFVFAREAAPNATLIYNDFNDEELPNKAIAIASMVTELNEKYATEHPEDPRKLVEGIGIQGHYSLRLNLSNLEEVIKIYAATGCQIHVTELDVQYNGTVGKYLTDEQQEEQAVFYAKLFMLFKKYSQFIDRVTFWGVDDANNWRSSQRPLLFDVDRAPKKAYWAVVDPEGYLGIGKDPPVLTGFNYDGMTLPFNGYEADVNVPKNVSRVTFTAENLRHAYPSEDVDITVSLSAGGAVRTGNPCVATVKVAWADTPTSFNEYQVNFGHMSAEWANDINYPDSGFRSTVNIRFSDGETALQLEQCITETNGGAYALEQDTSNPLSNSGGAYSLVQDTFSPLPKNASGSFYVSTGGKIDDTYLKTLTLKKSLYDENGNLMMAARLTDFSTPESYYKLATQIKAGSTYIIVSSDTGKALTHKALKPVPIVPGDGITQSKQGYEATPVTIVDDVIVAPSMIQDNIRFMFLPRESPDSGSYANGYNLISLVHGGLIQPFIIWREDVSAPTAALFSDKTIGDADLDRAVWFTTDMDPNTHETTLFLHTASENLTYVLQGNDAGFVAEGGTSGIDSYKDNARVKLYEYVSEYHDVYDITCDVNGGGLAYTDVDYAAPGDTVTIYAEPSAGNVVTYLQVVGQNGENISTTNSNDGYCSFIMPASSVNISVYFGSPSSGSASASGGNHAISIVGSAHGSVKSSSTSTSSGNLVTLTVTAEEGYVLDTLSVTDSKGVNVPVTNVGNGQFTFKMPQGAVSISATFVKATEQSLPFTDVPADAWYYKAVLYAYNNGLMSGTDSKSFSPNVETTRGMLVTILYRMEGTPGLSANNAFSDVRAGAYYADAVAWASANKLVTGYSTTAFGPDDSITREQLIAVLYRYAQYKGCDVSATVDLSSYADAGQISEYARPMLQWACAEGLISGTSGNTLSPSASATRAQVVTILMRFAEYLNK